MFILSDPEKYFTSVLPRLTLLPYSNYAQGMLRFFLKRNYHKIDHLSRVLNKIITDKIVTIKVT